MLIPIYDDNTGRRSFPAINYLLIAINIFVFIIELQLREPFQLGYSVVPYKITHGHDIVGPVRVPGVGVFPEYPGPSPIWLTLFTSMFMHAGWAHILGNMLFLWIFGDNVEDNFGHAKYLIFYLLCGLAADFSQIAADPNSLLPSLGASGAIAGVLGAYIIMFPTNRVRVLVPIPPFLFFPFSLPAIVVIGLWILLQLFSQVSVVTSGSEAQGGVAYMAHIGGFFAGLLLTLFFRTRNNRDRDNYYYAR